MFADLQTLMLKGKLGVYQTNSLNRLLARLSVFSHEGRLDISSGQTATYPCVPTLPISHSHHLPAEPSSAPHFPLLIGKAWALRLSCFRRAVYCLDDAQTDAYGAVKIRSYHEAVQENQYVSREQAGNRFRSAIAIDFTPQPAVLNRRLPREIRPFM